MLLEGMSSVKSDAKVQWATFVIYAVTIQDSIQFMTRHLTLCLLRRQRSLQLCCTVHMELSARICLRQ